MLLPDGHITDGHIFLVDFHYNVAVVKVAADLALLEVVHLKDTTHNGAVLALGRAYEGGNLMCSRGQLVHQTSIFGCSELLVSSCKVSMVQNVSYLIYSNLVWSYCIFYRRRKKLLAQENFDSFYRSTFLNYAVILGHFYCDFLVWHLFLISHFGCELS